jgi:hypothetical protein
MKTALRAREEVKLAHSLMIMQELCEKTRYFMLVTTTAVSLAQRTGT